MPRGKRGHYNWRKTAKDIALGSLAAAMQPYMPTPSSLKKTGGKAITYGAKATAKALQDAFTASRAKTRGKTIPRNVTRKRPSYKATPQNPKIRSKTTKATSGGGNSSVEVKKWIDTGAKCPGQSTFNRLGSYEKLEAGSFVEDPAKQTVYVGVGPPMEAIFKSCCRAIVSKMLKMGGITIEDWTQPARFAGSASTFLFQLFYFSRSTGSTQQVAVSNKVNCSTDSWQALADQLANMIRSFISSSFIINDYEFVTLSLIQELEVDGNSQTISRLAPRFLKFNLCIHGEVSVQNQTQPASGNADVTDDIRGNPLDYKVYTTVGNKFHHNARVGDALGQTSTTLLANNTSGVIATSSDELRQPVMAMLPDASYFMKTALKDQGTFAPGKVIRYSIDRYQEDIGFRKLFQMLENTAAVNFQRYNPHFGESILIGCEKTMDTREIEEQPVRVGFQVRASVGSYCTYKDKTLSNSIIRQIG